MKYLFTICLGLMMGLTTSCIRFKVDPIEVKPIHITMEINIKVDEQLDDFFAFEEELEDSVEEKIQGKSAKEI